MVGKPLVGRKLTAVPGTWRPAPVSLRYQWLRNGKRVKGATARAYRLSRADVGKRISVRVTGRRTSYATATVTSPQTAKIKRR